MNLLKKEKIIISSNNKIILTNKRIIKNDEIYGRSYNISIFLEDISSIENLFKSKPIFLILGIIFVITGILYPPMQFQIIGLVLVLILFILWWHSRKHIINIIPNGGTSILILVEKMNKNDIDDFVFNVIKAKDERINEINKIIVGEEKKNFDNKRIKASQKKEVNPNIDNPVKSKPKITIKKPYELLNNKEKEIFNQFKQKLNPNELIIKIKKTGEIKKITQTKYEYDKDLRLNDKYIVLHKS